MKIRPTSGPEPMTVQEAGRKGGSTTRKRHGASYYAAIGSKGGQRTRELIEAGRKALAKEKTK